MSIFTASTPDVTLPITTGKEEPSDTVRWVFILDMFDADPWIIPCEYCTVVEGDSSHQAGCDTCRGRGWFSTTTGLPVKLWWWQSDRAAAANWLIHTATPTLLRAAGYDADADRVDGLPKITAERLAQRITGTGMLEELYRRLHSDFFDRLQAKADSGSSGVEAVHRAVAGHPFWDRARDAYLDFRTSRMGEWAYRITQYAPEIMAERHDGSTADLTPTLDRLVDAYEDATSGLVMVEEDIVLGPERPALHGAGGARCQSRYEHDGALYRCDVHTPPRSDPHHTATGPDGPLTWTDEDNVDVPCTATLATPLDGAGTTSTVQCVATLYRHPDSRTGDLEHHWYGPEADGYPDYRSWTDTDDGATAADAH